MEEEWHWFDAGGQPVRAPSAADAARKANVGLSDVYGPYRALDPLLSARTTRGDTRRLRWSRAPHRGDSYGDGDRDPVTRPLHGLR